MIIFIIDYRSLPPSFTLSSSNIDSLYDQDDFSQDEESSWSSYSTDASPIFCHFAITSEIASNLQE